MPEVSQFLGIVIGMFFNDHNPPHFHATYGGCEHPRRCCALGQPAASRTCARAGMARGACG
jgi:hypothetical protein